MKEYRWHTTDEIPTKQRSIVILLYKHRQWSIDYGYYYEFDYVRPATGEVEHHAYVEEYDNRRMWSSVKKWCYDYEFNHLIQKTFDTRQRVYHLRKTRRK